MIEEVWKECKGYPGVYVSNLGNVREEDGNIPAKYNNKDNRIRVYLRKPVQRMVVHLDVLVATAFLDNPEQWIYVGYKDDDRNNCCADNLYWKEFRNSKNREKRKCLGCGNDFEPRSANQTCCCQACRNAYDKVRTDLRFTCPVCGNKYFKHQRYCSKECRKIGFANIRRERATLGEKYEPQRPYESKKPCADVKPKPKKHYSLEEYDKYYKATRPNHLSYGKWVEKIEMELRKMGEI